MSYLGRKLPLAVEYGRWSDPPPLSVSHLVEDRIVLEGGLISGAQEFREEIAFVDQGKRWENADLYSKLTDLNSKDIPFRYQPKDMEAPSALMAWWQDIGKLQANFKEITWRSPDQWLITIIQPPVIGTRGWTGPKPFGC